MRNRVRMARMLTGEKRGGGRVARSRAGGGRLRIRKKRK